MLEQRYHMFIYTAIKLKETTYSNPNMSLNLQLYCSQGDKCIHMQEGRTPLIIAAYYNHMEIAKDLLNAGADVNATSKLVGLLQL